MNQLKSIYNSPFKSWHSHPIHTCLAQLLVMTPAHELYCCSKHVVLVKDLILLWKILTKWNFRDFSSRVFRDITMLSAFCWNDEYISFFLLKRIWLMKWIKSTSSRYFQIPLDSDGFPPDNIIPPLNYDPGLDMYTMTAYFVDPGKYVYHIYTTQWQLTLWIQVSMYTTYILHNDSLLCRSR